VTLAAAAAPEAPSRRPLPPSRPRAPAQDAAAAASKPKPPPVYEIPQGVEIERLPGAKLLYPKGEVATLNLDLAPATFKVR
jgi:hypothetical protein